MDEYSVILKVKNRIKQLIEEGELQFAKTLLEEYENKLPKDVEIYSMMGVIAMMDGKIEEAEKNFLCGLEQDSSNFDLLYNLGYLYESKEVYTEAVNFYRKAEMYSNDKEVKKEIIGTIEKIKKEHNIDEVKGRKIAFFVKQGMDGFLGDIIENLSDQNEVKKIIVTDYKQIDEGMEWADICWFEWCDELVAYGSKLPIANVKKIICRLHRYEALTEYPQNVSWNNVDKLIVVTNHLKLFLNAQIPDIEKKVDIITINNGVNLKKYKFEERIKGFNLAYVGYIHQRKNPILLLQVMKKLVEKDNRYKLYLAGQFQDTLIKLYWDYQIKKLKLEKHIIFEGWKDDIDQWLKDKNCLISTSIHESFGYGIAEGMARGLKPVIHDFVFSEEIWDKKYLFNTIDEAIDMITSKNYDSKDYRKFVEDNYSLSKQMKSIKELIWSLNEEKKTEFNYKDYWNHRLNNKFDIEGVGYIGLGQVYNRFLYRNRIEILEGVLNTIFSGISDRKVLELGPGIGVFTDYFNENDVKKYDAIDISERSIKELSSKYKNYNFIQGDISDSKNYQSEYDLVFAADVLLHITDEENYKKTIKNIAACLKDDGICILLEPITLINTESKTSHVVIRDKEYIETVLSDNHLKLAEMLPIAYFMNYPFDRKLIDGKADIVLELFNLIGSIFSSNIISNNEKELIGDLLLQNERRLLYKNKIGLSQKLLVIQKSNVMRRFDLDIQSILKVNDIEDNIKEIIENKMQNFKNMDLIDKLREQIYHLEN